MQSSFSWPSAPYDEEALKTLQLIASLAPVRIVKNGSQSVRFPQNIQTHVSQDAFLIIVNKMIADSNRLKDLFPDIDKKAEIRKKATKRTAGEIGYSELLPSLRGYNQSVSYFPNLRISDAFIDNISTKEDTQYLHDESRATLNLMRTVSTLYHENSCMPPKEINLNEFFIENQANLSLNYAHPAAEMLSEYVKYDSVNSWMSVFEMVRSGKLSREKTALTLGLLVHEGVSRNEILLLQAIAHNSSEFKQIEAPRDCVYSFHSRTFDRKAVYEIFETSFDQTDKKCDPTKMNELVDLVEKNWRNGSISDSINPTIRSQLLEIPNFDFRKAIRLINDQLFNWHKIKQLGAFVDRLEAAVLRLTSKNANDIKFKIDWPQKMMPPIEYQEEIIDFDVLLCANLDEHPNVEYDLAEKIFKSEYEPIGSVASRMNVIKTHTISPNTQHLVDSGLFQRFVPSLILPKMLTTDNQRLRNLIGALAVTIAHEQRLSKTKNMKSDISVETVDGFDWSLSEHPELILIEIEQKLNVTAAQIKLAQKIVNTGWKDNKRFLLEYAPFVEGVNAKSLLIIVLITALFAKNTEKVNQLTISKMYFDHDCKMLRQCLGGMLNRRLYTFLYHRKLDVDLHLSTIFEIFAECQRKKGNFYLIFTEFSYQ